MTDDRVLSYDPYAGDFGSPGDKVLENKMVVARKFREGDCHICRGDIAKGERHRKQVDVFDGQLISNRWCALCCAAMALNWDDDGVAICARQDIHA